MTKITDNNQRIVKWDIAKGVLIFLVVLGHMLRDLTDASVYVSALYLFIYSFHMPCFLFIDGLFSKKNVDERRYSHIFSYLIIYIVCKALISLTRGFINGQFSFDLLNEGGIAWYGLALFWCSLLTIFLKRFPKKWVLCASIILGCMIGYDNDIGYFLSISRTIVFYPFFFVGYCIDPKQLAERIDSICMKINGAIIMLILAIVWLLFTDSLNFVRVLLTGRSPYSVMGTESYGMEGLVVYGGLLRLLYYIIVAILCVAFLSIIPSHVGKLTYLATIGKRTLQIYLLHRPVIYILYDGLHLPELLYNAGISNLVIIPLAVLLTLLLSLPFWETPIRAIIYPQEVNKTPTK